MPDWKDKTSYERLLAAVIAAHPGLKLDYRKMATYFGHGGTYDAIEGRFRPIRKCAEQMKKDVESGTLQEAPLRGSASGNVTPRKARVPRNGNLGQDAVLNGRVAKPLHNSPTRRREPQQPKGDMLEVSISSSCTSDIHGGNTSDESCAPCYNSSLDRAYEEQLLGFQGTVLVDSAASVSLEDLSFWSNEHIV